MISALAMSPSARPLVSVVVVTFHSASTLDRCLAALKAQTVTDYEAILLDNASGDGAAAAAAAADPSLRLLQMDANLGFAAGNNRAAEAAAGHWLVLLNPDAYPETGWLEQLLAAARANPAVRCFTSRQLMDDGSGRLDGLGDAMTGFGFPYRGGYGRPDPGSIRAGEVFSPCGGAMMIERDLFLAMGGFDEDFFCFCEDADLGYRLRLAGEAVRLVPDAIVVHEGSVSTGGRRSDFSVFHGVRNRLWLFIKNTPPALLALTVLPHLALTALMWPAALARGNGGAFTRGLCAAIKGAPKAWAKRRPSKRGSLPIASHMTWNPLAIRSRKAKIT